MIASDPNQTVEVSLKLDKDKPDSVRPMFLFRFLTCRQVLQVDNFLRDAGGTASQPDAMSKVVQAIRIGMVGWRNVEGNYDPDRLLDLLTPGELWQLAFSMMEEMTLKEIDLGKSVSPSDTSAGHGAKPATPAAA